MAQQSPNCESTHRHKYPIDTIRLHSRLTLQPRQSIHQLLFCSCLFFFFFFRKHIEDPYINRWVKLGKDLDLLDSPGMLPMRIEDQAAAMKLAICDDIGEKAYDFTDVSGILVQMLARIPEVGAKALYNRYKIQLEGGCGKKFVKTLGLNLFGGDNHQAAFRILTDFRKGKFGYISLERPPP